MNLNHIGLYRMAELRFSENHLTHVVRSLASRDYLSRKNAIDKLKRVLYQLATEEVNGKLHTNFPRGLRSYLPCVLRLSVDCPFDDVKIACTNILSELKTKGVKVPRPRSYVPSRFIPAKEIVSSEPDDEQTQMLFIDAFLQNNRLDHITQLMGHHPHYLNNFLRTQHFILRGDGPLPYDYRHYIAIMAAGRHQCSYLINLQRQEFLLQGGDERWLKGLDHIPSKLRELYELNKLLAHRPWLINHSHIKKLTKGKPGENWSWSVGEVCHAVVLLSHFHGLSSFVYGCGISTELDHENGHTFRPSSDLSDGAGSDGETASNSPPSSDSENAVDTIMRRMKTLSEQSNEPSQEEIIKRFEKVEKQSLELSSGVEVITTPKADISCFIDDPGYMYQDFAKRGEVTDIPTFRIQDYSWDDHGFSLANQLYSDVGTLLDEKFKKAYGLTYYTMGGRKNVDTTMFRRAVWNYIQCVFGIRHDDYDYGEVNQLLDKPLKAYIKTVCCYPERTTRRDYDSVMKDFRHSEKVHVNLMLLEARLQAEMLYALRAISRYMT